MVLRQELRVVRDGSQGLFEIVARGVGELAEILILTGQRSISISKIFFSELTLVNLNACAYIAAEHAGRPKPGPCRIEDPAIHMIVPLEPVFNLKTLALTDARFARFQRAR